ncbi:MAG TPA: DUF503 domain-containing protein [Ilumatobacteraceae bacterium]|jgi:uncharacterized protein YlxP (DUF503 family)|nr:DUF503 domain-containing protein [Ilumatobacteraceae bacterium]
MFVLALEVDVHITHAQSLKDKRGVIRSIVDGARHRYHVAAAEVGDQNLWQRAQIGFAAVSGTQQHTVELIDQVSRFVWSFPEINVLDEERTWLS